MSLLADETPWVMISHSCSSSLCPPLVDPEPLPEPVLGIAARSIADLSRLQDRELAWLVRELDETLHGLKHGLEDCYALLAPIDPGSNLLVSTPRNDLVKGTLTRVGTRIVKGTIHLRLRTLPHQTLTLNPDHPIHVGALSTLHTLLTHSIDLITLTLSHASTPYSPNPASPSSPPSPGAAAAFISAQLRLLSQSLADAAALLRGPPLTDPDPAWTSRSASPSHFDPVLPPNVSFHLGVQDSSLVLWLRALEPADAPLNLGMKFALAIGTARRIDHDEADRVFGYCCEGAERTGSPHTPPPGSENDHGGTGHGFAGQDGGKDGGGPPTTQVYVREKVRVETADPSLLSLSAKLSALSHTLALARQNLAAVMGEDIED